MAFIAAATSTLLVVQPAAAAATTLEPPASPTQVMALTQLPGCAEAGIRGTNPPNRAAAAQLGWKGAASVGVPYNSALIELVPTIPCRLAIATQPSQLIVPILSNRITSGDMTFGKADIIVHCISPVGAKYDLAGFSDMGNPGTGVTEITYAGRAATTCDRFTGITVKIGWLTPSCTSGPACVTPYAVWTWDPLQWRSSDGGWDPATTAGDLLGDGIELPIVCTINTTGADLFELGGNVVRSIIEWFPCMLLPVGWDRAELIGAQWDAGPTGDLQAAYEAAIPDGIACGVVAVIPVWSNNVTLNTCAADFAPSWGKVAISWILVLGLAVLVVKRIMWSVGSRG